MTISSINSIASQAGQPVTAPALKEADTKKLKDTAVQMEATFNGYMLDEMVKGLPGTSGGKTDEFSGEVFGGIFKQAIATQMAQQNTGPTGIAQQMYQQMLQKHARSEAQKQGIALPAGSLIALRATAVNPADEPLTPLSK
ncbi:hypothetical protein SAMN05444156_2834 [Verrucomicrobium sp. GAS474]|uniref:hypothetical protein n=1 Tax=Verrucomicrobium sp. GAS474 TaxID=1882831 RepID=UPI00087AC938|nr:hypothetical protein [Verrucomicrobium sp. GAS474]SDU24613.1 hypothetical protein SAMN05444156_2834 [Verrucomicrobium sp. GAS474]